jgi:hypothetical protein
MKEISEIAGAIAPASSQADQGQLATQTASAAAPVPDLGSVLTRLAVIEAFIAKYEPLLADLAPVIKDLKALL